MKGNLIVLAFMLIVALPSFAADSSSGCGLGWAVVKDNSLVSSALRMTTNGILFNGTLGMTFGTSGCAKHSIVMNDKQGEYYAEANYHQLMIDMALGKGEYLSGLAYVMGCDEQAFSRMTQQNYAKIMGADNINPMMMYQNIKAEIKADSSLSQQCFVM